MTPDELTAVTTSVRLMSVDDRVLVPQLVAGSRVLLQPATKAQAQAVLDGVRPGDLALAPDYPHDDTADGLRMALSQGLPPGWWVVVQGEVVGDCGVHGPVSDDGEIELGYGLAPSARGRGVGSEVVGRLAAWLSVQPQVRAVVARGVRSDNAPSRRVLEAAGFRLVADHGDTVDYRLEAD